MPVRAAAISMRTASCGTRNMAPMRSAASIPKTAKITEWQMPVKWQMPYDALANKKGDVYTGSVMSDRIVRLDPKTGEMIVYLMPSSHQYPPRQFRR